MTEQRHCLVDTPVLVRLANSSDALHDVAFGAVAALHLQGVPLCIAAQNLIEFRNVATRPVAENGLGYSIAQTEEKAAELEALFTLLEENAAIYPAWKALVHQAGIIVKQVHDARLVALCQVHGVSSILTFNQRHFLRFLPHVPGLAVVDPHTL
jgi:predicted nucleic acid-binding protein